MLGLLFEVVSRIRYPDSTGLRCARDGTRSLLLHMGKLVCERPLRLGRARREMVRMDDYVVTDGVGGGGHRFG